MKKNCTIFNLLLYIKNYVPSMLQNSRYLTMNIHTKKQPVMIIKKV